MINLFTNTNAHHWYITYGDCPPTPTHLLHQIFMPPGKRCVGGLFQGELDVFHLNMFLLGTLSFLGRGMLCFPMEVWGCGSLQEWVWNQEGSRMGRGVDVE
jgi:hypothetical protein